MSVTSIPEPPAISLVIPAWNEAVYLPRLLDTVDVARARYGADRVEVIVADNDSTDDTAQVAASRGCRVAHVAKRAIAAARNGGAAIAQGQWLAFVDADIRIHPGTFGYIDAVMSQPGILGGATGLVMERWSAGITATWYAIMPLLWLLGFDGGVVFCRRRDFVEVGGYDEKLPCSEDVHFMKALMRLGTTRRPKEKYATHFIARRLSLTPAIAINSCRKFDKHGDWHMLREALRGIICLPFSRKKVRDRIWQYWYEDRA
jgi:glycosyltransferase involved in cell wall biosynthesis